MIGEIRKLSFAPFSWLNHNFIHYENISIYIARVFCYFTGNISVFIDIFLIERKINTSQNNSQELSLTVNKCLHVFMTGHNVFFQKTKIVF